MNKNKSFLNDLADILHKHKADITVDDKDEIAFDMTHCSIKSDAYSLSWADVKRLSDKMVINKHRIKGYICCKFGIN